MIDKYSFQNETIALAAIIGFARFISFYYKERYWTKISEFVDSHHLDPKISRFVYRGMAVWFFKFIGRSLAISCFSGLLIASTIFFWLRVALGI